MSTEATVTAGYPKGDSGGAAWPSTSIHDDACSVPGKRSANVTPTTPGSAARRRSSSV